MPDEILSMSHVSKVFPGVVALSDVSFTLNRGEIHSLIGANGAGKSTLIKVLAGAYQPDGGSIVVEGQTVELNSPLAAQKLGIAVIYQEFTLFPNLDIAKNIYFGNEPKSKTCPTVDWNKMHRDAQELLNRFGLELDPYTLVGKLSVAQQQMVEIAKALATDAKILVMDEPTATLTPNEVERLFAIIESLRKKQVSIIYISHRLDEVDKISDRVTVLRGGKVVDTQGNGVCSRAEIVHKMVGDISHSQIEHNPVLETPAVLEVKNLSNRTVSDISFELRRGEVLGIAGLVGAGRTELMCSLFGADASYTGSISIDGAPRSIKNPKDAIAAGIGMLPESRKEQGLFMNLNIRRNTVIANLKAFTSGGMLNRQKQLQTCEEQICSLKIKTPGTEFFVKNLSGGNQQKVVLAKWICVNGDILILDEPTRGVDIGAKEEIFSLVQGLATAGKSIIFISSELEEVLRVSNRILTLYKGRITGTFNQKDVSMDEIMHYITGGIRNEKVS